jgi:hypothetical protein
VFEVALDAIEGGLAKRVLGKRAGGRGGGG